MVARQAHNLKVGGSSPSPATNKNGNVVQIVERIPHKDKGEGAGPSITTIIQ